MRGGVDWVVHLAAYSAVIGPTHAMFRDNVVAMGTLLEAAEAAGVGEVTFASSSTAYREGRMPATEDQPLAPVSLYGWSKLFSEELVRRHPRIPKAAVVRFANVIGPNSHGGGPRPGQEGEEGPPQARGPGGRVPEEELLVRRRRHRRPPQGEGGQHGGLRRLQHREPRRHHCQGDSQKGMRRDADTPPPVMARRRGRGGGGRGTLSG